MRRKPEFDRFHAGLATHCDSIYKKICDPMDDYSSQDFTNELRSKLSTTWKYLIEKINKLEQELKSKDQKITHLESAIKDMSRKLLFFDRECAVCSKHKETLDQLNKELDA